MFFTREAEAAEITDAISELSYLAARKSKVAAELRKLGHQRCPYENEMARILRREAMAAALIEGTWEFEKKKKKLAAELAHELSQKALEGESFEGGEEEEKEDEAMEEGLQEEEEKEEEEEVPADDPEEKTKKKAKLAKLAPQPVTGQSISVCGFKVLTTSDPEEQTNK